MPLIFCRQGCCRAMGWMLPPPQFCQWEGQTNPNLQTPHIHFQKSLQQHNKSFLTTYMEDICAPMLRIKAKASWQSQAGLAKPAWLLWPGTALVQGFHSIVFQRLFNTQKQRAAQPLLSAEAGGVSVCRLPLEKTSLLQPSPPQPSALPFTHSQGKGSPAPAVSPPQLPRQTPAINRDQHEAGLASGSSLRALLAVRACEQERACASQPVCLQACLQGPR